MKKLIMLVLILINSLTVFSQRGTDSVPTKTFTIPVVKQIVKDLLSGDSAKAELKITAQQLKESQKIVSYKDSVVKKMEIQNTKYEELIKFERSKYKIIEDELKSTEKKLKKEKIKTGIFKTISTVSVLFVGALLITN
jgi:hypothetical protein